LLIFQQSSSGIPFGLLSKSNCVFLYSIIFPRI
jgi:hypothetical protein